MTAMLDAGSRVSVRLVGRRSPERAVVVTRPYQGGRPVMVGTWFVRLDDTGRIVGVGSDSLTRIGA